MNDVNKILEALEAKYGVQDEDWGAVRAKKSGKVYAVKNPDHSLWTNFGNDYQNLQYKKDKALENPRLFAPPSPRQQEALIINLVADCLIVDSEIAGLGNNADFITDMKSNVTLVGDLLGIISSLATSGVEVLKKS